MFKRILRFFFPSKKDCATLLLEDIDRRVRRAERKARKSNNVEIIDRATVVVHYDISEFQQKRMKARMRLATGV